MTSSRQPSGGFKHPPGQLRAGAGDRPGQELALQASDDRHAPEGNTLGIRAVRAELVNEAGFRVAILTMLIDVKVPRIVMYAGDPYLRDPLALPLAYRQERPYRADCMIEGER